MRVIPLVMLLFVGAVEACEIWQLAPELVGEQELPVVSRNSVFWVNNHKVYGSDLRQARVFSVDILRYSTEVAVDAPFVAWVGFDKDSQIYFCDIRRNGHRGGCLEQDEKYLVTDYSSLKKNVAVGRHYLVWQDYFYGNWDIVLCDLRKNGHDGGCLAEDRRVFLTSDLSDQIAPSIGERWVAWEDYRFGSSDILGFDLIRNAEVQFLVREGAQSKPLIRGNFVYFEEHQEGNLELKVFSLRDHVVYNLTNSPFDETNFDLDGNLLVYETSRFGVSSIGILDLRRNATALLSIHDREYNPSVSGRNVAFESIVNATKRVYVAHCTASSGA